MRNIIQDQLTTEEKEKVEHLITQLENLLGAKPPTLTEKERQDYKALG